MRCLIAPALVICACQGSATSHGVHVRDHTDPTHRNDPNDRAEPTPPTERSWLDEVTTPTQWAVLREQEPPPHGFVDFHRAAQRFDVGRFDEVRIYHRRFDRWGHLEGFGIDHPSGCDNRAVAPDGTLCPSVVMLPGRVSLAAGEQLVSRFNASRPATEHASTCTAIAHHAFVFYRQGIAVGELLVDLDCPTWSAWPGFTETIQRAEDVRWLNDLCEGLEASICRRDAPDLERQRKRWEAEHMEEAGDSQLVFGARIKPRPLGVPTTKRLDALTEMEKRRLCVWNTQHVFNSHVPDAHLDVDERRLVSFPDETVKRWGGTLNWQACVDAFPSCSATLAEVVSCMDRAQRGDMFLAAPESASCRPLRSCLWGFVSGEVVP